MEILAWFLVEGKCWGSIARPLKIRKSNLESFGLMLAFLAFTALRLKLLQLAESLCQNGPHKAKKLQNFDKCSCGLVCGLWKKILAFFIFLEALDTYEVQWYTKIMYVSSISRLTKTKPKFPFRHIVGNKDTRRCFLRCLQDSSNSSFSNMWLKGFWDFLNFKHDCNFRSDFTIQEHFSSSWSITTLLRSGSEWPFDQA